MYESRAILYHDRVTARNALIITIDCDVLSLMRS